MAEVDVEKRLTEIRERVRAQIRQQTAMTQTQSDDSTPGRANEVMLEALRANLSVIERSWNRLPPMTSYRRGSIARFELWFKRLLKKATHWFTWEQVNFNSATAKSTKEILAVLSNHEDELMELRRQLKKFDSIAREGSNWQPERLENHVGSLPDRGVTNGNESTVESATDRDNEADITELARRIEDLRSIRARHDIT
jgi:hypothetical protein